VNLFDVPEMMPGAMPRANPAEREEFEQRCRMLHQDEVAGRSESVHVMQTASGATATNSDLEAMFPALDPALVRSLAAEAPTPQHAIETLLALACAISEPGVDCQRAATPPPRNLGVEDMEKFPSLMDADGWQVVSQHQFDRDEDEDLGSAWRDRAKAAADLPAPKQSPEPSGAWGAAAAAKRRTKREEEESGIATTDTNETDYDFRQRRGERRAQNRVQFGRGGGGRGRGAQSKGIGRGVKEQGSGSETSDDDAEA
jgi:hypothetical protein